MWPRQFNQRLDSWVNLRTQAQKLSLQDSMYLVNQWWFDSPWIPYYLHWDDMSEWPDPWQLLSDNMYCGVARGLGIMYTIAIMNHSDIQDARLVQTSEDNLVLVNQGKYILNYEADSVVNKHSKIEEVSNQLTLSQLKNKIK